MIPTICVRCGGSSIAGGSAGSFCLKCSGLRVFGWDAGGAEAAPERPDRIGPFEIIEELGQGGMGRVYAARQAGLGRVVALKTIPRGRGAADLELRFNREMQTVAMLRHPNIIVVYDCGSDSGCLYYSMDYIEGGDLAASLRERAYTPQASAILMRKVALALAYAHEKGVLHRDLKPSNILLDGDEPKLADFGLAAQLEAGGDLTSVTGLLGTPHYLAPEGFIGGSAALGVASDVYALGVVLFQMLTGRTPFAGAAPAELPAVTTQTDPPSPRLLAPNVPSDLATICLKCLEREPTRRYASAADFAEDLRRFLSGEPIVAQPPSASYRFAQFARRHRTLLAAVGAVALVLVAATIISGSLAIRATHAEVKAAAEAAKSREVIDYLEKDLLLQAAPNAQPDRDIKLRTLLDRAAETVGARFTGQPLLEATMRETLATTYQTLGEFAKEKPQMEKAYALDVKALGPNHAETLAILMQIAWVQMNLGQTAEGIRIGEDALRRTEAAFGPNAPETLEACLNLTAILHDAGKMAEGEIVGRRAVEGLRQQLGAGNPKTVEALNNLGSIYWSEGKTAEAEAIDVECVAAMSRLLGRENPETLSAMNNLASVYWSEDKLKEAQQLNQEVLEIRLRVLGPDHPETIRSMHNLATCYRDEAEFVRARELQQKVLAARQRLLGAQHPDTISEMAALTDTLTKSGAIAEAEVLGESAVSSAEKVLGPEYPLTLTAKADLAAIREAQGRQKEAEDLRRAVRNIRLRAAGPESKLTLESSFLLGRVLVNEGKFAEGESVLRPTFAAQNRKSPDAWRTFCTESLLGEALLGEKAFTEAGPLLAAAYTGLKSSEDKIPPVERYELAAADKRLKRFEAEAGQQRR